MKTAKSNVAALEQRKRNFRTFREEHQHLAFQMLFPKEEIGIVKGNSQPASEAQHLPRYGIVHYNDNKPHFIHRTFAEYYVADILMDQLAKETTLRQEILDILLKDILLKENYPVIASILDGFLEEWKPSKRQYRTKALGKFRANNPTSSSTSRTYSYNSICIR